MEKLNNNVYNFLPFTQAIGFTQLMLCVLNNDLENASKYLSEINAKDNIGWTALHLACRNLKTFSSNEMVKFLLKNGADPNARAGNTDWTPLHYVSMYSADDSLATVEVLLKNGADPNAETIIGWKPLHFVLRYSNSTNFLEITKLLLRYSATPIDELTQILKLEIDIESFIEANEKLRNTILSLENEEN